jgi:hypothetical protein
MKIPRTVLKAFKTASTRAFRLPLSDLYKAKQHLKISYLKLLQEFIEVIAMFQVELFAQPVTGHFGGFYGDIIEGCDVFYGEVQPDLGTKPSFIFSQLRVFLKQVKEEILVDLVHG